MHDTDSRPPCLAQRCADGLFLALKFLLAFCMLVMVVLVFGNVVLRYGFNSGINISDEVSRLAFVWLTFSGAVLAFRSRQHLAINMLVFRMTPGMQKFFHAVRQLLILWVLWLMMDGGWQQTVIGLRTVTPVAGVPIAVFSGAVFLSSVALALMTVLDLYTTMRLPATAANAGAFFTSTDNTEEI